MVRNDFDHQKKYQYLFFIKRNLDQLLINYNSFRIIWNIFFNSFNFFYISNLMRAPQLLNKVSFHITLRLDFYSVGLSTQNFKYLSLSTCKKNTQKYLNFFKYFLSTQKNTQFFSSIFRVLKKILNFFQVFFWVLEKYSKKKLENTRKLEYFKYSAF